MRILILPFLLLITLKSIAQEIDKETYSALNHIKIGYIQHGFDEFKIAASKNSIAGQYYIAICYEQGIGVQKNLTEAFRMYRRTAERGLPDAMYRLASFYRDGIVVAKDANREKKWLNRFNQKGGKFLLPDLVQIYNEGLKHPENYSLNPRNAGEIVSGLIAQKNNQSYSQPTNITIVQQFQGPLNSDISQPNNQPVLAETLSDVDLDIPITQQKQENTFALIIANENYLEVANVSNALHDGKVFADYCEKTLGIPQTNIKYVADATLNIIRRQLNWITQVMEAYDGESNVIVYYAGHGIPDESNQSSYLLPIDGYGTDVSTGYSLDNLYLELSSKPAKSVIVLLDACFSGTNRDGSMLASARGVAIKAKQNAPKGNMVVLSAAQGDETAYPYSEKGHGMFTYYLLKKIQETKGNVTLGELSEYVIDKVKKQSIVINGKLQSPTVLTSTSISDNWKIWKLK